MDLEDNFNFNFVVIFRLSRKKGKEKSLHWTTIVNKMTVTLKMINMKSLYNGTRYDLKVDTRNILTSKKFPSERRQSERKREIFVIQQGTQVFI